MAQEFAVCSQDTGESVEISGTTQVLKGIGNAVEPAAPCQFLFPVVGLRDMTAASCQHTDTRMAKLGNLAHPGYLFRIGQSGKIG